MLIESRGGDMNYDNMNNSYRRRKMQWLLCEDYCGGLGTVPRRSTGAISFVEREAAYGEKRLMKIISKPQG